MQGVSDILSLHHKKWGGREIQVDIILQEVQYVVGIHCGIIIFFGWVFVLHRLKQQGSSIWLPGYTSNDGVITLEVCQSNDNMKVPGYLEFSYIQEVYLFAYQFN